MVPKLSERTFTRLFTLIVYFSTLELGLGVPLKTVLALAPSPRSVANWIRWGARIDDHLTTQDLKRARARGVFVATDAGEAANMKRQMTALTYWDFGLMRPRFVPADCMRALSGGAGAAKNVTDTLRRLQVELCYGGTTDSAPEVLSVMPVEMRKTWPDYKLVVGCVLHILNLIIVGACLHAFGDEAMGVCGALRLAYVVNYLQKKYPKAWASFLERTSAGPEFGAIVPAGTKGRWWSLAVAWGCILRDPSLYSDFFMYMANDTTISDTFRSMLRETSAWLVTPKALADMQFQLCFILTWWVDEMKFAQGYPEWMNDYPEAEKTAGMRAAEYSVRVVTSHLDICSHDPEKDPGYESYRKQRACCSPGDVKTSCQQACLYLSTAVVVKEKHHERWLRQLADLSVGFPDKNLRSFIVARFLARYDDLPDPEIPSGTLVKIWGENYELQVVLDHLTQFIDSTSLQERSSLMHDVDFVESMRIAAMNGFDEEKSGCGGALYFAMVRAKCHALLITTHGIEKLVQTSNLFSKPYSSRENEDRVPCLLSDRVETQDEWVAAVVACRDIALPNSVRQEATERSERSLVYRPGSRSAAEQLHRTNNKSVIEAFITNFEAKVGSITREVVEAAEKNAHALEASGHSRRAASKKRDKDALETSADAVKKATKRSTAFDKEARAKMAAKSTPFVPASFSGMLNLNATKSADFGAEYTRATFIAECEMRNIELERKDGVVKASETIDKMKTYLTTHHGGDRSIPRMTVNGTTPGSAFLGTKQWSVPPEPLEAAEVSQENEAGARGSSSAHTNVAPTPPSESGSHYRQLSQKKLRARSQIRHLVSEFHNILVTRKKNNKSDTRGRKKKKKSNKGS